jgi:hypothetical protein
MWPHSSAPVIAINHVEEIYFHMLVEKLLSILNKNFERNGSRTKDNVVLGLKFLVREDPFCLGL